MAVEWRKDLTFGDRLAATSKMHREYHEAVAEAVRRLLEAKNTNPSSPDVSSDPVLATALPISGTTIGRYVNAQHHKDGLFSEVFKAARPESERRDGQNNVVALKLTSPDAEEPPHDSRREARLLQAAKHERIVTLLETFQQAGGRFVLVFPFLPHDLAELLQQRLLTLESGKRVLRDLFSALAYLHAEGIVHRDIKPSNLLLASSSGPAYLCDLGIAWSPSDTGSEPADEKILDVATTCYRPPELLFGNQKYGTKLDMWSAGCVAAQIVCLQGRTLFDAGDLGSELALIRSMFETLGTPDFDVWPEAATFPDWGKMNFRKYLGKTWSEIMPDADVNAIGLVSNLVVFESSKRLSADAASRHPYLQ